MLLLIAMATGVVSGAIGASHGMASGDASLFGLIVCVVIWLFLHGIDAIDPPDFW